MKGTLDAHEYSQHQASYMNTLARSQSGRLSPTLPQGYNTTSTANMPLPYSSMGKLPNFS